MSSHIVDPARTPWRRWGVPRHQQSHRRHGPSPLARWLPLLGGGTLAGLGIARRSWLGLGMAAGGGFLVYRGITAGSSRPRPVHVEVGYTVNKPIEQVWQFWRNFENLPRFMTHLASVKVNGPRYSYWTARTRFGDLSWDAEITDERENQYLVWRSLAGSQIDNTGSVEFRRAPADRGTEIHVAINYQPPAGKLGDAVASLLGESLEQQVREDVRHFKQLLEAGEIPSTDGQPHGRRSLKVKLVQRAWREPRAQPVPMPRTA